MQALVAVESTWSAVCTTCSAFLLTLLSFAVLGEDGWWPYTAVCVASLPLSIYLFKWADYLGMITYKEYGIPEFEFPIRKSKNA